MDSRPIGVFDSGVGGLTVLRALSQTLPHEDIIYLGDTARVPYGTKSKATVARFSVQCFNFLKRHKVKLGIVACNTASSWAIQDLKRAFKFPILGVIKPGVKEASKKTRNNKIGVIGTKATIGSMSYVDGLKRINDKTRVYQKACPLFVPLVEENELSSHITKAIAKKYLAELNDKGIDTLILGCTHYPLLKNVIKTIFNRNIIVVDSSISISTAVKNFLVRKKMSNRRDNRGDINFFVTDDPGSFQKVSSIFLKRDIMAVKVDIS